MPAKPSIGVIGSGRLGTAVARASRKAGYPVRIANNHGVESLTLLLSVLVPGAVASTIADAITQSDIIVLALPLRSYRTLPVRLLAGKLVIDAMNYWAPVEGHLAEFSDITKTTSELVQAFLPNAVVVKTLNSIAYNELEEHATKAGSLHRRAMAISSNNAQATQQVSAYVSDLGFEPVDFGALSNGRAFQPDTPAFNARLSATELTAYRVH